MQREEARKVITSALWLAKERAVGELDAKEIFRERVADLMARMKVGSDNPPATEDLSEVLVLSDPEVGEAVMAWSQEDAPAAPQ